jgi:RNA polymerase sigma-70 factor (ECF subfamily)
MADFDQLITEHIPRLRRYARALVGDVHSADDLVQDCLERAWSRQHLYDSSQAVRPWLFSIMHNLYANAARQYHRAPPMIPLNQVNDTIDAQQETDLSLRDLERSLALLANEHREVLLLVGLEQLSYKDTAEVLNIPLGTVMSRLTRARDKLREFMLNQPAPHIRRVK